MKFIHTADVHYGKRFSTSHFGQDYGKIRYKEVKETFDRMIDYANKEEVDFILISGDLIHNDDVLKEDLYDLNTSIAKLEHCKIILISGNHDTLDDKSVYKRIEWSKNLVFADGGNGIIQMNEFNLDIYTHSWTEKKITDNVLKDIEIKDKNKRNILMLHGDTGKTNEYFPINIKQLKETGFDYIALGHIHNYKEIYPKLMYYPGTPEPLDTGEIGKHGFLIVNIGENYKTVEFVDFSKRKYCNIILNISPENLNYDIEKLIEEKIENKENIYQISLEGYRECKTNIDISKIQENFRNANIYIDIEDKTMPAYDLDELKNENKNNIIGKFIEKFGTEENMNIIERKALFLGIEELLRGKSL